MSQETVERDTVEEEPHKSLFSWDDEEPVEESWTPGPLSSHGERMRKEKDLFGNTQFTDGFGRTIRRCHNINGYYIEDNSGKRLYEETDVMGRAYYRDPETNKEIYVRTTTFSSTVYYEDESGNRLTEHDVFGSEDKKYS